MPVGIFITKASSVIVASVASTSCVRNSQSTWILQSSSMARFSIAVSSFEEVTGQSPHRMATRIQSLLFSRRPPPTFNFLQAAALGLWNRQRDKQYRGNTDDRVKQECAGCGQDPRQ